MARHRWRLASRILHTFAYLPDDARDTHDVQLPLRKRVLARYEVPLHLVHNVAGFVHRVVHSRLLSCSLLVRYVHVIHRDLLALSLIKGCLVVHALATSFSATWAFACCSGWV